MIAVCLDMMGRLTSLRVGDSERYVYHPVTGTGLLKPLSGLLTVRPSPLPSYCSSYTAVSLFHFVPESQSQMAAMPTSLHSLMMFPCTGMPGT